MRESLYFLAGVTSSGKSALAMSWAASQNAEILSCDSIALYRGMDLGAAKPSAEDRKRIPHHGLDLAEVTEGFDVSKCMFFELGNDPKRWKNCFDHRLRQGIYVWMDAGAHSDS